MNPDGPRQLGQPRDAVVDLLGAEHHQFGHLVDDDDDVGHGFEIFQLLFAQLAAFVVEDGMDQSVVLADVPDVEPAEYSVTGLHFFNGVKQDGLGFSGVLDHRAHQVRDAFVGAELDPLGVDQNELDLIRRSLVEKTGDQAVESDAFTGSRRTRDQEMGHIGQVGDVDFSVNRFAQGIGELGLGFEEFRRLDDVTDANGFPVVVGDLDSKGGLAGDAADADGNRRESQGDLLRKIGHLADLDAGIGKKFVGCDDRSGVVLLDLARHTELGQFLFDEFLFFQKFILVDFFGGAAFVEKVVGGKLVAGFLRRWKGQFFLSDRLRRGRFHRVTFSLFFFFGQLRSCSPLFRFDRHSSRFSGGREVLFHHPAFHLFP